MGETINSSNNIMDECYGKQIDYYNQFPNSSRVIEDLIERLEKAESKNEKYKKCLFNELKDCSFYESDIHFMVLYSDGSPSADYNLHEARIDFKIDKNNEKIILEIYQTRNNNSGRRLCQPVKILRTPAIIDINDNLNMWQSDACGDYFISFKNKADWEKRRRQEIEEIRLPQWSVNEEENDNLVNFLWTLLPDF
jgi:hypothetical protein